MAQYLLGFIGTGNMGGALVRAACRKDPAGVLIFNRTPSRAQALSTASGQAPRISRRTKPRILAFTPNLPNGSVRI